MRALLIVGVILIVLGVASFFIGLPQKETAGISIGGAKVGVETRHSERIPIAGAIALLVGGVVLTAVGARSRP